VNEKALTHWGLSGQKQTDAASNRERNSAKKILGA
jgi:hypothetical protein